MREAKERGKTGCGQQNKKETQQKEGRKHKESEMNGEGCEEGEREPEEDIIGCLHRVKTPDRTRQNQEHCRHP